jgi:hypothetical protein
MAIALAHKGSHGGGATVTIPVAAGSLVCGIIAYNAGAAVTATLADTVGTPYTTYGTAYDSDVAATAGAIAFAGFTPAGNAANVIAASWGGGVSATSIIALEYTGVDTAGVIQFLNGGLLVGTPNPSGGNITPSFSNSMIVGLFANPKANVVPTAGSGFTIQQTQIDGTNEDIAAEDFLQGVAASHAVDFNTGGTGSDYIVYGFALPPGATPPGLTPPAQAHTRFGPF